MRPVEEQSVRLGRCPARVVLTLGQAAEGIRTARPARTWTCHGRVAARG